MAEIISNKFTTTITRATQTTTTKEVVSNQFTTTISRATQTTTKEVISNQFTTTISRVSDVPATLGDDLSTVINIYKKGVLLTPVSGTPTTDEYAVTITGTTGCTATLEDDKKTIKLLTITGNTGRIDVSINIENKETYIKSIPVASITGTQAINSAIIQKADEISSTVSATYATKNELNTVDDKFDNYSTTSQMNSAITQKANEITSSVSETYATKTDLNTVDGKFNDYSTTTQMNSAITQKANSILSTVSETYATKDSIDSIIAGDINLQNYPTTIQMNSAINQKADEITSTVSQTYATKTALKDTDDKFADYSTTTQMNSAINQKANEITSTVSETYATKTTTNNMLSQIQQNANSISTKVDVNGVISSINQSSETISINANKINLNGYVSNDNANWSIDNEGNMKAENLKIEGEAGADTLSVNYIDNPCYPATLAGSVDLYINSSSGNDDYTIDDILQSYDEAEEQNNDTLKKKFKTIQGAIDAIPKFLNNKTVYITMETNSTEDVYIRGVVGGAIRIYMNGKTLFGTLKSYACSATITTYGGTKDNTEGATGIIHPSVGMSFGSRAVSVGFEASQYCAIYKVKVFAPDSIPSDVSSGDKVCVASQSGTGSVYCKNIEIVNAVIGFRSNNHGSMHVNSSSGVASKYGFQSATGGIISIANNSQCGGKTSATNKGSGGQIWYDDGKPTFATGNQTVDGGTAPVVSTTKTMTIKSSYGDTYRSSVYDNWKKDGTVRQGDYGYGDCTGCWFFGTAFSELKGKTITKVQITIKRQTGGSSVPVEHKLWMHGHTVRPSGAPKLTSGWSQTFRLATGNSTTVAITNSTVLNAISAGTCKGFALRNTYDSAHYSVCSGSVTVKITYTE